MLYYIARNGEKFGPFSVEQLAKENISADTLVWYEGLSTWVAASTVPELSNLLHRGSAPAPSPIHGYNTGNDVAPAVPLGKAIFALIFFWPFGIPALIHAIKAKTAINNGDYQQAAELCASSSHKAKLAIGWGIAIIIFCVVIEFLELIALGL